MAHPAAPGRAGRSRGRAAIHAPAMSAALGRPATHAGVVDEIVTRLSPGGGYWRDGGLATRAAVARRIVATASMVHADAGRMRYQPRDAEMHLPTGTTGARQASRDADAAGSAGIRPSALPASMEASLEPTYVEVVLPAEPAEQQVVSPAPGQSAAAQQAAVREMAERVWSELRWRLRTEAERMGRL